MGLRPERKRFLLLLEFLEAISEVRMGLGTRRTISELLDLVRPFLLSAADSSRLN